MVQLRSRWESWPALDVSSSLVVDTFLPWMASFQKHEKFMAARRRTDQQFLRIDSFQATRRISFVKFPTDASRVPLPADGPHKTLARFYFEGDSAVRHAADECDMVIVDVKTTVAITEVTQPASGG